MQLILNEYKYVEDILANLGNIKIDTTKKLIVLIKYYKDKGMSRDQIFFTLVDIMTNNYPEFNLSLWNEFLKKIIKTYSCKKYTLRNIESVTIYKSEMDYITSFKDGKLERILFIMLVYAKINNANGWINTDVSNIFKDSDTSSSKKDMYLYIHKLKNKNIVEIQKQVDGKNVRIDFIENNGEVAFNLTKFQDAIMDYYIYKGKKVKTCEVEGCEKRILIKNIKNTSQKYCSDCKRKMQLKQQRESMKKVRK